eukprot:CAMPEP_0168428830 /NCGR_PEP_ID=MMETSP0228-20121227/37060_1 /TAXON_ID=133427 /ORGANISM="Protoceratium reticulatum, Strain CCCM 535 (=CCMP 1889)" /LENGTH=667 /DNA_ID=CAMNT_0008442903 /DNA_START=3 /DNA_END=2003 /DNA_ORIENTATION=+
MKHKDGCMAFTTVPRPALVLPPVTDCHRLNMFLAWGACLDVQGMVRHVISGKSGDDGDDARTRPSVPGRLEEHLESPTFLAVGLMNGPQEVGQVKVCYKVVCPQDKEWVSKLNDPRDPDRALFEEAAFRKRYKLDQPMVLRVRTYVVRGLNVSGANAGHGNPYLFFTYGQEFVRLVGHRQLATVEPRFFRTEERDVHLPDQATFEVGLYDWQEGGEDALIGKTCIDLEDRWFTPTFQTYMKQNKVPVEYRPLQQTDTGGGLCKGSLEMWVEILDATTVAEVPTNTLQQPPAVEVEIRAVCYAVRNMSRRLCVDDLGEQRERVDIIVRCSLDCRSYLGGQQKEQETDIHYGSEGEGEFNWRFVFSRVAVTRGIALDCFLQFSIWEHFALKRPQLICENLIEMKNYCKKAALQGDELQMEAELPLMNKQLSQLLAREAEGRIDYEDGEEEDSEDEDNEGPEEAEGLTQGQGADKKAQVQPAALMKVMVQVLPQTQANSADEKVGLARDEPNRNPILSYPKTGRSWENVLPSAAKVIESIIENVNTGKRRCKILAALMVVVLIIGMLHYIKNKTTGCPYIQRSCKQQSTCAACACCFHNDVPPARFCFYGFMGSPDKVCSAEKFKDSCNIKGDKCALEGGNCETQTSCFRTPRQKGLVVAPGGTSGGGTS